MAGTPGPFGGTFDKMQGFFDPGDALGQQRERESQEALEKRFREMQHAYQQYRPEAAQSRMNALNQQLGLFNPINQLLTKMYGGQGFDLAAAGQNPITPGSMALTEYKPEEDKEYVTDEYTKYLTGQNYDAGGGVQANIRDRNKPPAQRQVTSTRL